MNLNSCRTPARGGMALQDDDIAGAEGDQGNADEDADVDIDEDEDDGELEVEDDGDLDA